jgi:hypothetical protein
LKIETNTTVQASVRTRKDAFESLLPLFNQNILYFSTFTANTSFLRRAHPTVTRSMPAQGRKGLLKNRAGQYCKE